jgi:hypothetical protein
MPGGDLLQQIEPFAPSENSFKLKPVTFPPERRDGPAVHDHLELGRKLHREIARLLAAQNAIDIGDGATKGVYPVGSVPDVIVTASTVNLMAVQQVTKNHTGRLRVGRRSAYARVRTEHAAAGISPFSSAV